MPHPIDTFAHLTGQLRELLTAMQAAGCRGFEASPDALEMLARWDRPLPRPVAPGGTVTGTETLDEIRADLGDCRRCPLSEGRRNLVFGEGDAAARLVFVGEGPGFEEDAKGRPFVGPAGRLLTRIIEAMHLRRDQVYICNVIKCRPPDNRTPLADEIETCAPFLRRQLAAIRPEYICALGAVAARYLLNTNTGISRLRGRIHEVDGLRIMPTWHPAYLLRNPERKRDVWEDMKQLMALMGLDNE